MTDPQLKNLIEAEESRQQETLELIPSENYVSKGVLRALGTVYTNKYSEGYPGRRYYGGQINTDQVEALAIARAKSLFGADHANVQSHSGAQANEAVYHAWLKPGETVLAMELSHGGHLTHGHPVTVAARQYKFVRYGMSDPETGALDYNQIEDLARQQRPKIIVAGFSSYPRELDYEALAQIGKRYGCLLMADVAHLAGLIAAGCLANPLEAGFDVLTSTTHKTLRGPRGGLILSQGQVGNPLKAPPATIEHLPTIIDRLVFPGLQGGPHMHTILAKAVAFWEASQPDFKLYAQTVLDNAKALAAALKEKGFKLVTNGTDNHLLLVDMIQSRGIDGAAAEKALEAVGLNCNKNVVPDDARPAFAPSGLRLGTPAITTRGMKPKDMVQLADWFDRALQPKALESNLKILADEIRNYACSLPLQTLVVA